jgi:hypothetical protein
MLKFYAILEDGTQHILRFNDLRELWKWTGKHYIKEIKTLDETDTYLFEDVQGNRVQG